MNIQLWQVEIYFPGNYISLWVYNALTGNLLLSVAVKTKSLLMKFHIYKLPDAEQLPLFRSDFWIFFNRKLIIITFSLVAQHLSSLLY